jgi:outer membrane lipoprotein-sorting protein
MSFAAVTRRVFVGGMLAAALLPGAARALTEEERAILMEISQKLSGIKTMNGEFVQFDPNGAERHGRFFIARPGRVRFQYDPPDALSVISDGESVLVFDKKLQTYDLWPLSQTPLRLLLDSGLDLATSNKVTRVSIAPDLIEVELYDKTRFTSGTLTLVFNRSNYELRQWTVRDEQDLETLVVLYNVETGNQLASDLFKIDYNAATNAAREKQRK